MVILALMLVSVERDTLDGDGIVVGIVDVTELLTRPVEACDVVSVVGKNVEIFDVAEPT